MKEVARMPLPLIMYGSTTCDDTDRTREHLQRLEIPFREILIDDVAELETFVRVINGGHRSTPTLVFGEGRHKRLLTEPSNDELEQALLDAGYELPGLGGAGALH
jgi:mycoredoxin